MPPLMLALVLALLQALLLPVVVSLALAFLPAQALAPALEQVVAAAKLLPLLVLIVGSTGTTFFAKHQN